MLGGGVNMREAQIYILKTLKNILNWVRGGVISQLEGSLLPPRRVVEISLNRT